ncbi:MAG TPA: hypothetical protein VM532_11920, partial [Burkholderiales bacterium]|nr:hypothetical protein [Burkholderiales bacterium]
MKLLQVLLLACVVLFAAQSHAAPTCPVGALSAIKGQRLFLYFPTADDATYPEHGTTGVNTSPLRAFDVANLDAGIGTTDQLRNRIFDFVTDDYCEFSVSVETFTTTPPQTDPRWQQVGIGSDGNGAGLFGEAQAVDTNDVVAQDFARVWSNAFGESFGGAGGALAGANSTLERWATAVSHTVAHEAAHNYGAAHRHSAPRPGSNEDEQNNHVLATGSTGLTGEIRASRDRHFSDQEYEILAHNVGLNIKTLLNWDFVNPNNTNANRLRLRILTTSSTLTLAWFYTGDLSPWTDPTITNTGATQLFQGVTYNVFNLDFSVAKTWSGGVDGVVPPAVRFHVGASFAESGTVFVFDGQLFSDATQLPLFPRMFGFDSGTADLATGDFNVSMFNPSANRGPLIVRQLELLHVPRMVDINTMVANTPPTGLNGVPIDAVKRRVLTHGLPVKDSATIPIARFADKRDLDIIYGPKDCPPGSIGFQ